METFLLNLLTTRSLLAVVVCTLLWTVTVLIGLWLNAVGMLMFWLTDASLLRLLKLSILIVLKTLAFSTRICTNSLLLKTENQLDQSLTASPEMSFLITHRCRISKKIKHCCFRVYIII